MNMSVPSKGISIVMKVSMLAGSVAALASLVVGTLIVSGSTEIVYEEALNRLRYETNLKSIRLISDIKNLSGDVQYLAGTPPIQGIPRAIENNGVDPFDNSSTKTWGDRLATIFSELIRAKPNYQQIRYIGLADNGSELIRVDRKGSLIKTLPEGQLQEKGSQKYFKNAIKLNPGEVYLSDVTLNREFGKVSEPHTPVIRAATPIYHEGELFGILVINMEFGGIFKEVIRNTPRELVPYVTNEDGYFLAHPDINQTFGFDLGNEVTIRNIYNDFELKRAEDLRDVEYTVETNGDVVHVVKAFYDPSNDERFFAVMLATSYINLQSKSEQLRYTSYTIMGVLVLISLILAGLLASRLMKPLKLISAASEDLAHGREVSDLPTDSGDEIGELARSFDDMRHQLEDKERELIVSQGHVHHANKMASLGEMAAGMAHEINSPLQAISLTAQRVQRQLKRDISPEEIEESMQKVTNGVKKISEIIDSLRSVSRTSSEDDFEETSLKDIISDTVNMTEERFKLRNIDFDVVYHEISENTHIQCQRLQISQVLINLVNNAFDAIEGYEEKWIRIDLRREGKSLIISVSDSGKGVPAEIIEKIFEPMFTTKDVGKGTGLGLSISSDIIAKHYGRFYIDKKSEHTRFVVELPVLHMASI